MFDVCMLVDRDRPIHPGVFAFTTSIECRFLIEYDTEEYKRGDWLQRVADLRTRALGRVETPFWVSLDSDVVVTADTLLRAYRWLHDREDLAAVGIYPGEGPIPNSYPMMGCAIFRTAATKGYRFRIKDGRHRNCECQNIGQDLTTGGWRVEYHPTLRAGHRREP